MKLIYGIPSPYSRKVRLAILEKELDEKIEFIATNPFEKPDDVQALNPLGKVPILILGPGQMIFDSPVICEFVDTLSPDVPLYPEEFGKRFEALRWQALADGIMDATYSMAMELKRDPAERSSAWLDKWADMINRGLDAIEEEISYLNKGFSIAHLAVASVPDYIDLRAAEYVNWREGRPAFVDWFEVVSARPSMKATHPTGVAN